MNPFTAIPPKVRQWLYLAYGVVGLVFASVITYTTAVGDAVPEWVAGSSAVLVVVGTALGFTAASNIDGPKHRAPDQPNAPYTGGH